MKRGRIRQHKRYVIRLLFTMLIFTSLSSCVVLAKYVLTRTLTFAVESSTSKSRISTDPSLLLDLRATSSDATMRDNSLYSSTVSTDGTFNEYTLGDNENQKIGSDGYTLTYMIREEFDGELFALRVGENQIISSTISEETMSYDTGCYSALDQQYESQVPLILDGEERYPIEITLAVNPNAEATYVYINSRLVQVFHMDHAKLEATGVTTAIVNPVGLCSLRLYNRILSQAEMAQIYYRDLLDYGAYVDAELPPFLQNSSVLRLYSTEGWEDQSINGNENQSAELPTQADNGGIIIATDSNAALIFPAGEQQIETSYTARYVLKLNGTGEIENLFSAVDSASGESLLNCGFDGSEFYYTAGAARDRVDCSAYSGKISIAITVDGSRAKVYVNGELDHTKDIEAQDFLYDSFFIDPSGAGETQGWYGLLYEIELYKKALSDTELAYLYQRDVERFSMDDQLFMALMTMEVGDAPTRNGQWSLISFDEIPEIQEEEGYQFSHWFCEEYNTEFMEEDFVLLFDAMEADGYNSVNIRPVYTALPCIVTFYDGNGTLVAEISTYYGLKLDTVPKCPDLEGDDGSSFYPFKGWSLEDDTPFHYKKQVVTGDIALTAVYDMPKEETAAPKIELPLESSEAANNGGGGSETETTVAETTAADTTVADTTVADITVSETASESAIVAVIPTDTAAPETTVTPSETAGIETAADKIEPTDASESLEQYTDPENL